MSGAKSRSLAALGMTSMVFAMALNYLRGVWSLRGRRFAYAVKSGSVAKMDQPRAWAGHNELR